MTEYWLEIDIGTWLAYGLSTALLGVLFWSVVLPIVVACWKSRKLRQKLED